MEAMTSEREAFEKWIATAFPHIAAQVAKGLAPAARDAKEMAWAGWQAARLAQPAQAVDVGAKLLHLMLERGCSKESQAHICTLLGLVEYPRNIHRRDANDAVAYFSQALSGEKAGPVGDGVYPVSVAPKDAPSHSIELLVYLPEHGWRRGFYTGFNAERGEWPWSAETFPGRTNRTITHWTHLPASPTPDKEG